MVEQPSVMPNPCVTTQPSRSAQRRSSSGRERRPAAADHPQRPVVVAVDQRIVGERQHHRRHHDGDRHAVPLDRRHEGFELEARQKHGGGAHRQRGGQQQVEPHGVEQRQRHQHDVALADLEPGLVLPGVGDQARVGQLDALRQAGGAARVQQRREIVDGLGRDRQVAAVHERRERGRAAALAEDQDPVDQRRLVPEAVRVPQHQLGNGRSAHLDVRHQASKARCGLHRGTPNGYTTD
jgi:hypothetical protein